MKRTPHLVVIDGSNMMMRALYGYPNIRVPLVKLREEAAERGVELTALTPELEQRFVDAVRGMLARVLREFPCTHLVWAQDSKGPTFRHASYAEYKGTRERKFPGTGHLASLIEPHLKEWGICSFGVEGFEADDLLATLGKRGKEKGTEVTCVSGDNDVLQLVANGIKVVRPNPKGDGYVEATDEWIRDNYGYGADQVVCWKILRGDSGDNIPAVGIPSKPDSTGRTKNLGVSERKALELLARFGSLKNIYAAAELDPQPVGDERVPSPERERLIASKETARKLYRLVRLRFDVPLVGMDPRTSAVSLINLPASMKERRTAAAPQMARSR